MNLGRCRIDVAIGQAGEADLAIGIVAAEVVHEVVVDAQHLVRRLAILHFSAGSKDAVNDLGIDAVAVELLDPQMRVAGAAVALFDEVVVEAGFVHLVDAQLLAGDVLGADRADPSGLAEIDAVIGHPALGAVRLIGDKRHLLLQGARRLRGEEIRRQPDHIEMTIGRDAPVLHSLSSTVTYSPAHSTERKRRVLRQSAQLSDAAWSTLATVRKEWRRCPLP